jgi:hypothetical protein
MRGPKKKEIITAELFNSTSGNSYWLDTVFDGPECKFFQDVPGRPDLLAMGPVDLKDAHKQAMDYLGFLMRLGTLLMQFSMLKMQGRVVEYRAKAIGLLSSQCFSSLWELMVQLYRLFGDADSQLTRGFATVALACDLAVVGPATPIYIALPSL